VIAKINACLILADLQVFAVYWILLIITQWVYHDLARYLLGFFQLIVWKVYW